MPYDLMLKPDGEFVDGDGRATMRGTELAKELIDYTTTLEASFGQLYMQMDTYESFWRMEARRFESPEDRELNRYLPAYATNEGRVLADKIVRANVRDPVRFRVRIGAEWSNEQRVESQRLERQLYAAHVKADEERYCAHLGLIQSTLAWQLAVRGVALCVPYVRASSRQNFADDYGDEHPFMVRTPDPRECVWEPGPYGLQFFARHFFRPVQELASKAWLRDVKGDAKKKGLVQAYEAWWLDEDEDVWYASVVENQFVVEPVNRTKERRLKRLPVIVDTAFGAPSGMRISSDLSTTIAHTYQGAMENNINAYLVTNTINAYEIQNLKDGTFTNLAIFTRKELTAQDQKDWHKRRAFLKLDPNDRPPQVLAPPQISESVRLLDQKLMQSKQQGGMPDIVGGGVPDGLSALYASEVAHRGDLKAGPVSDALRRIYLASGRSLFQQLVNLRRRVKLASTDARGKSYVETVDPSKLPKAGDYILETVHEPYLARDEYRDAQTAQTWRVAGKSALSIFDEYTDDPTEEENRRLEELMKADPGFQALELAAHAAKVYPERKDIQAYFMQKAALAAQPAGGQTNAPRASASTTGGTLPQLPGGPATPMPESQVDMGEMIDPTDPATQAMLGAQGAALGG